MRGHKGGIRVTSKPGQGTTFQVLFPAIETPAPISAGESIPAKPWHGTGTVLVVDDEEIVRSLAKKMVEIAGFSVLTANDGEEAVRMYREHQDEIACVLLDLTMPKMGGEETFRAIRQISPDVRVVLSSGYSEETATGRFAGLGLAGFIQKPYQLDTMIATLREAVGGDRGDDSSGLRWGLRKTGYGRFDFHSAVPATRLVTLVASMAGRIELQKSNKAVLGFVKLGCLLRVVPPPSKQTYQFLIIIRPPLASEPIHFNEDSVHGVLAIESEAELLSLRYERVMFFLLTLRGMPSYEGFFRFDSSLLLYAYSNSSMKTASGSGLYR